MPTCLCHKQDSIKSQLNYKVTLTRLSAEVCNAHNGPFGTSFRWDLSSGWICVVPWWHFSGHYSLFHFEDRDISDSWYSFGGIGYIRFLCHFADSIYSIPPDASLTCFYFNSYKDNKKMLKPSKNGSKLDDKLIQTSLKLTLPLELDRNLYAWFWRHSSNYWHSLSSAVHIFCDVLRNSYKIKKKKSRWHFLNRFYNSCVAQFPFRYY